LSIYKTDIFSALPCVVTQGLSGGGNACQIARQMVLCACKRLGSGVASLKGASMTLTETVALLMLIIAVIQLVVYIFRKKK